MHPYHHEVIGDTADLQSMTRDDLYHHYRRYYAPNNALVAVAGDFETQAMLDAPDRAVRRDPARPDLPERCALPA